MIKAIQWIEAEGRYRTAEGKFLSSPSRILRPLTIEKYKDIPQNYLNMAKEFGTKIHDAILTAETVGYDEARAQLHTPAELKTFESYAEFMDNNDDYQVIASETVLYNLKDRYYGYADLIVKDKNGHHIIIDIKTRASLDSDDDHLCEALQLMLYADAYESMHNIRPRIAMLILKKKTKSVRLYKKIDIFTQRKLQKLLNGLKKVNVERLALNGK